MLAVCAFGCSNPSLVGEWKTTLRDFEVDMSFKEDGTLVGKAMIDSQTLTLHGTYKLDGDDITIRLEGANASNPMLEFISQRIVGSQETGRVEWKNDHHFIVTARHRAPIPFDRIENSR